MNDEVQKTENPFVPIALGIVGAIIGAVLGGFLFQLAYGQGFYMLALPGALIGIGCGMMSRRTSVALAIFCALLAAVVTMYLEWTCYDESFNDFISTLDGLPQMTWIMLVLGVLFAGWFGLGRENRV